MTIRTASKLAMAVAFVATTFTAVGVSFDAEARFYTKDRYVNRDECFKVKKIPQLIEVDTRGIPVAGASRSWKGNMRKNGSIVKNKFNDPVFIQTVTVLEDQHYTLIPTKCK